MFNRFWQYKKKQNILLFINNDLYNETIDSVLNIYMQDVESEGYSIKMLTATHCKQVVEFRDFLINEWKTNDIKGIFLVGDLPVPYYEMANDFSEPGDYVKFPSDLYFMDLDGIWLPTHGTNNIILQMVLHSPPIGLIKSMYKYYFTIISIVPVHFLLVKTVYAHGM